MGSVGFVFLLGVPSVLSGQTCAEPHYRWSEKADTALATLPATLIEIPDILQHWSTRTITAKDKCAARFGREKRVFAVEGWVRRIKQREADGDWHIELTDEEDTPVNSCVIVEIPSPSFGQIYGSARDALKAQVDFSHLNSVGDLDSPVRVRFTGAAFFDGFHQSRPQSGGAPRARQHGRCNSSLRALWELHPIYKVAAVAEP